MTNQIINVVQQSILAIVTILIGGATQVAISYLKAKKEHLVAKLGAEQYNTYREMSIQIFHAVEQQFKGLEDVGNHKASEFDKKLLGYFPTLTKKEIDDLREYAVGKINAEIKANGLTDRA